MKLVMSPAAVRRAREIERKKRMARHVDLSPPILVACTGGKCHVVTTLDIDRQSPIAYALPAVRFPPNKANQLGDRCVKRLEKIARGK